MTEPTPEPDADDADHDADADDVDVDDPGGFDGRFLLACIAVLVGLIAVAVGGWAALSYVLLHRAR